MHLLNRRHAVLVWAVLLACVVFAFRSGSPGVAYQVPPKATPTPAAVDTSSRVTPRDAGEYDTYINALNIPDPVRKAAAMEAFVANYPNSSIKTEALEQAMGAYQQSGNTAKVVDTANRLLSLDRSNVHALALLTYVKRNEAAHGSAGAIPELQSDAARGIGALTGWTKPQGMSSGDFGRQREQMSAIFEGGLGFVAFLGKDYAGAREHYLRSVRADPNNLQDVYQLGLAQLQLNPIDVAGFWYIAKAWTLAGAQKNPAAQQTIDTYAKAKYFSYHGGADGWDAILENARANAAPPADFAVTAAH